MGDMLLELSVLRCAVQIQEFILDMPLTISELLKTVIFKPPPLSSKLAMSCLSSNTVLCWIHGKREGLFHLNGHLEAYRDSKLFWASFKLST